jgi:hypothetical protein
VSAVDLSGAARLTIVLCTHREALVELFPQMDFRFAAAIRSSTCSLGG